MPLITTIRGHRLGALTVSANPTGKAACARCGFERRRAPRPDRRNHNLCSTCVSVLTPEQRLVWES